MNQSIPIGKSLRFFLADYLPRQRNFSSNTILAYRDVLKQLLVFCSELRQRPVANLNLFDIDRKTVLDFLEFVECSRGNCAATRNHRLAAIRSFFRCVAQTIPEAVEHCRQILAIPLKRTESKTVDYLTIDEVDAILNQISTTSLEGQRDDVLLRFLYNTGARVQETVDIMALDLRLDSPPSVRFFGKGRKERICPLWSDTAKRINSLLIRRGVSVEDSVPVFINRKGKPLTRFGVRYIVDKYKQPAAKSCPSLVRKNVHPHIWRHTCAMHLLQSGVDLNTIRCWLGHASVTTTNRYVEIDLEMKRRALDSMPKVSEGGDNRIIKDDELLNWLESL